MSSPKVFAAVGTALVIFGGTIPTLIVNMFYYLYGPVYRDVLGIIIFGGFLLWVLGNMFNYFAWRILAGESDRLVGFLFIVSALVHILPIIIVAYIILFPLPFGVAFFELIINSIYVFIALAYIRVGYGLIRV